MLGPLPTNFILILTLVVSQTTFASQSFYKRARQRLPWSGHHLNLPAQQSALHEEAYTKRLFNTMLSSKEFQARAPKMTQALWQRLERDCDDLLREMAQGASGERRHSGGPRAKVETLARLCSISRAARNRLQPRYPELNGFRISLKSTPHLLLDSNRDFFEVALPGDLLMPVVIERSFFPESSENPVVEWASHEWLRLLLNGHPEGQKVKSQLWMANGCYSQTPQRFCSDDFVGQIVELVSPRRPRLNAPGSARDWWFYASQWIARQSRHQLELSAAGEVMKEIFLVYSVRAHPTRSLAPWMAEDLEFYGTKCGDPTAVKWLSPTPALPPCLEIPLENLLSESTSNFIRTILLDNLGPGSLHLRSNLSHAGTLAAKSVVAAATTALVWMSWQMAFTSAPKALGGMGRVAGLGTKLISGAAFVELASLWAPNIQGYVGKPVQDLIYWASGGPLLSSALVWVDEALETEKRQQNHRSKIQTAERLESLALGWQKAGQRVLSEDEYLALAASLARRNEFFDPWKEDSSTPRECGLRSGAPAYLLFLPRTLCEVCEGASAERPEDCLALLLKGPWLDKSAQTLLFSRILNRDKSLPQAERHLQNMERLVLEWTGLRKQLDGWFKRKSAPTVAPQESPVPWYNP